MNNSFEIIIQSAPLLLRGLLMTFKLWISSIVIGVLFGTILGIITCNRLRIPLISPGVSFITFIIRGIPYYIQLLVFYFVLPEIIKIDLSPELCAIISLGLCSSSYICQIVRAGINSINIGQWEACIVLGFDKITTLRYIILPQMLNNVLPAFVNEFDSLVKSTAIISSIGVIELTRSGMNIVARGNDPVPTYLAIALLYLVISTSINIIGRYLERRFKYG